MRIKISTNESQKFQTYEEARKFMFSMVDKVHSKIERGILNPVSLGWDIKPSVEGFYVIETIKAAVEEAVDD